MLPQLPQYKLLKSTSAASDKIQFCLLSSAAENLEDEFNPKVFVFVFFLQEMGKYLFSACAMTLVTTTQQSFQLSSAPTASASSWFGFSRVRLALCMVWYNLPGEVGPLIIHGCSLKNNMSLFTASLALPSDDQMSGR